MTRPTRAQIDAALRHEFSVETPSEATRQWVPDASLQFVIPGPVALVVDTEVGDDPHDDLTFTVQTGAFRLSLGWSGAEGLVFALLQEMYGQQWARVLMALCARCPVNFEDLGFHGEEEALPDEVIQALWKAAYSYRDRWPDRHGGFDDHIWGVPEPKDVSPEYPAKRKEET